MGTQKNPIDKLKNYEAELATLTARYKQQVRMLQEQKKAARGKLEAARTHAIIQGSTYVTKALGLEQFYNITLDDLIKLDFKVTDTKSNNFDWAFVKYSKLMTDLGDFFYNKPEIVQEIQKYLQIYKSDQPAKEEQANGKCDLGEKESPIRKN